MNPAVTYVISAYNRPDHLLGCMASLMVQTDDNFEAIIADNATLPAYQRLNEIAVEKLDDERFRHINTQAFNNSPGFDCYHSAEVIVDRYAAGEYIVLPSDDSLYMPVFQETCLQAAREHDWQLIYVDMLYDRRGHGRYHHKVVAPKVCEIDKTCFMLRRDCWIGFPDKPQTLSSSCCDGQMIERLVQSGIRHGHVAEPLVVHN
jgi:hypothetical protein